jgi:hypothetical protein
MTPPEPWPFDCNPWPVPDGATATVAVTLYDPFLSPGGMVWGSIGN